MGVFKRACVTKYCVSDPENHSLKIHIRWRKLKLRFLKVDKRLPLKSKFSRGYRPMFNFFVKNLYLCGAIFIIVHVSWISVSYSHYPISVVSPQTYFGVCSSRIQMNETNKGINNLNTDRDMASFSMRETTGFEILTDRHTSFPNWRAQASKTFLRWFSPG